MAPWVEANWLGVGELALLLAGGWVLFARFAGLSEISTFRFAVSEKALRLAPILFGASLIPIGLSHLVYLKATVDLAPSRLPFRPGWAYLTGIAHMATGVAVLLLIVPQLAADYGSSDADVVYVSRLASCDCGRPSSALAMHRVLHLLDHHGGCLGRGGEHAQCYIHLVA